MDKLMDTDTLFFTLLFSFIGIGYFAYGKKNNVYFLVSGLFLMLYTYAVSTLFWEIGIGVILVILPFILNWMNPL